VESLVKCFLLFNLMIITGCVAEPLVKRDAPDVHNLQTELIYSKVINHLQHGDWIVIRGYHATDNLVAIATGIPLSHVGVYDKEHNAVIEAEGVGVHSTRLVDFIDKSYRVLVIRPRWSTPERSHIAVEKARDLVGKDYDFLGTIGFNNPSRYYCSELAVDIYNEWHVSTEKIPLVIKPGELYLWGGIIYDSMPRNSYRMLN